MVERDLTYRANVRYMLRLDHQNLGRIHYSEIPIYNLSSITNSVNNSIFVKNNKLWQDRCEKLKFSGLLVQNLKNKIKEDGIGLLEKSVEN